MKKCVLRILCKLLLAVLGFFAVSFTVYFFNLDMKATALLAPWLEKWTGLKWTLLQTAMPHGPRGPAGPLFGSEGS